MISRILNFLSIKDFWFKRISWKSLTLFKKNPVFIFICFSPSVGGNKYLSKVKVKLKTIRKPKYFFIYENVKEALEKIKIKDFSNKTTILIGYEKDCAYLYRKIRSENIKIKFLKI